MKSSGTSRRSVSSAVPFRRFLEDVGKQARLVSPRGPDEHKEPLKDKEKRKAKLPSSALSHVLGFWLHAGCRGAADVEASAVIIRVSVSLMCC